MTKYLPKVERIRCVIDNKAARYAKRYRKDLEEGIFEMEAKEIVGGYKVTYEGLADFGREIKGYFIVDNENLVEEFACDCPFQRGHVLCGHLDAMVDIVNDRDLKLPYYYHTDLSETLSGFYKALLDYQADQMLLESTKKFMAESFKERLESLKPKTRGEMRIDPFLKKVGYFDNILALAFRIGADKTYILKRFGDQLLTPLKTGEKVSLGKFFDRSFKLDDFQSEDQETISFIKENSYRVEDDQGYLILEGSLVDDTIEHFQNSSKIELIEGGFHVHLHVEKTKADRYEVSVSQWESFGESDVLAEGERYLAAYNGDKSLLYVPITKEDRRLYHHLGANATLIFNQEEYDQFVKDFLPQTTLFTYDRLEIFASETKAQEKDGSKDKLAIYLDLADDEALVIRLEAPESLDWQKDQVANLLSSYYNAKQVAANRLVITDEKNKDLFLEDGLPSMQAVGKVYVSDLIKTMSKPRTLSFHIGVGVQGGVLKIEFDSSEVDVKELGQILNSYRRKRRFHKLKSGERIAIHEDQFRELDELLGDLDLSEPSARKQKVPAYRMYQLQDLDADYLGINFDEKFQDMFDRPAASLSPVMTSKLRPYQLAGSEWLLKLRAMGLGGILADDMGLGKSLQMMAYLDAVYAQKGKSKVEKPSLIVVPASLIYNWEAEFKKFGPALNSVLVTGTQAERQAILNGPFDAATVLVTSYDYIRRDIDVYEEMTFDTIILDEAHYIKNQRTKTARAVKELQADYRFALTGTPIENSLAELWSIFDFLMPGYLYPYTRFTENYEKPIVKEQDLGKKNKLQALVSPFILRRLKKDVLTELPDKLEEVYLVGQTEEEHKLYQANLLLANQELASQADLKQSTVQILALLTRLRQLALDPRLLFDDMEGPSSKMQATMEIVEEARQNQQPVLIFSAFTSALDLLEDSCRKAGMRTLKLTGSTPKEKRKQFVETFQKGHVDVFLISLKAGGTGLNLTAANIVIHLDPWWNVSAQNQATDRAHRMGQDSVVTVYKMVTKGTIEEKIQTLQEAKKQLSDDFVETASGAISSMSETEIRDLFKADER